MNQDAHIYHEQQEIKEQYLNAATLDVENSDKYSQTRVPSPTKPPQQQQTNDTPKKQTIPLSSNRAVMSVYELYETKTRYYLIGTD
ncbi:unnamed protein product [Cunninghamella echinulata]